MFYILLSPPPPGQDLSHPNPQDPLPVENNCRYANSTFEQCLFKALDKGGESEGPEGNDSTNRKRKKQELRSRFSQVQGKKKRLKAGSNRPCFTAFLCIDYVI